MVDSDDPSWEALRELDAPAGVLPIPLAVHVAPVGPHPLPALDTETLRRALVVLLPAKDHSSTTLGQIRADLEVHFGLESGQL